jgi:hypothetical protein
MLLLDRFEEIRELLALQLLKLLCPLLDRRHAAHRRRFRFARGRTEYAMTPHALALQDQRDDREEKEESGGGIKS